MPTKILVAMSGGVDSSVAAALLHEEGCEVIGITLQLWGKDVCVSSGSRLCCSVRDALDAKAVAKRLGIRHETLELVNAFRAHVIDYFVDSYAEGLTPNPCIACNNDIKFGELLRTADELGAESIATGHYARSAHDEASGRYILRQAHDRSKDQSYVLFGLTQEQLRRARFPLGMLSKPHVREIAQSLGLVTADKPDSQDVCFVRDGNKDGFLRRELNVANLPAPPVCRPGDGTGRQREAARQAGEPGPIIDTQGNILGTHRGLLGYTIGQREGLGIAVGSPRYVVAIDRTRNRLIVGNKDELLGRRCLVKDANWVSMAPPMMPVRASVKIRSRHAPAPATIYPQGDGSAMVEFDEAQPAITPGQAAVFYDGDLVLGGGWIALLSAGSGG